MKKDKNVYISIISSVVPLIGGRYDIALLFSNNNEFINKTRNFLKVHFEYCVNEVKICSDLNNEQKDLIATRTTYEIFKELIDDDFDFNMNNYEFDIMINIPEFLSNYHIEIFGPVNKDLEWLKEGAKIGILAAWNRNDDNNFMEVLKVYYDSFKENQDSYESFEFIPKSNLEFQRNITAIVDIDCSIPVC